MSITPGGDILAEDLEHIRKISLTAAEALAAGAPVGISNLLDSNVAKAATTHRTLTVTPNADNNVRGAWAFLDTDKFLYAYQAGGDLKLVVVLIDRSNMANPFTFGTIVAATTTLTSGGYTAPFFDICQIDTNKFAVVYNESGAVTITRLVIGTVSGTTITLGTAVNADSGANNVRGVAICQIGTGKGAFCMTKSANNRAYAFTVSGTTATIGAAAAMGAGLVNSEVTMGKVATDKFVVSDQAGGYAQCGSISGTTVTMGTQNQYWGGGSVGGDTSYHGVYSPASNVVVISYMLSDKRIVAGTISGTTITFGSIISPSQAQGALLMVSSSLIYTHSQNDQNILAYSLSGNTLTLVGQIAKKITSSSNMRRNFIDMGTYWLFFGLDANIADYFIKGMSNNFIGFAQSSVARGAAVEVIIRGIDENQSGLSAGQNYLVADGVLTPIGSGDTINTLDDINVVKAISATSVVI